jgi:hypothetical protein
MAIRERSRLAEKSVYSLKNEVLGFIIRDSENGKYLAEKPLSNEGATDYSSDSWWADSMDDASVFMKVDDAFYALDDVATDFADASGIDKDDVIDRFEVNPIYSSDIYVKEAPLSRGLR